MFPFLAKSAASGRPNLPKPITDTLIFPPDN